MRRRGKRRSTSTTAPSSAGNQSRQITRFTPVSNLPELLTPKEFGAFLGIGRTTTYDLIRRREIPTIFFGRRVFISREALLTTKT